MARELKPDFFTLEEVASRFRVSRRTLQDFIRLHPYYRRLGRRKLFTEDDIARLYEALPCPSSSTESEARPISTSEAPSQAKLWSESTRVADRATAEAIRARREWECLQAAAYGRKATATFLEAAVAYMETGGERRFLAPLVKHFGTTPLAKIDQSAIDHGAKTLYPSAASATLNRQVHTPISAVLKFAAKRGMCDSVRIDRPRQPKGRIRWLAPAEADRLIGACSPHLKPLVTFLFYTGCRLSEGLYLDWKQVDLTRGEVQFLKTKNGEPRGVPLHASRYRRHRSSTPPRRRGFPPARQATVCSKARRRRAGQVGLSRGLPASWHY